MLLMGKKYFTDYTIRLSGSHRSASANASRITVRADSSTLVQTRCLWGRSVASRPSRTYPHSSNGRRGCRLSPFALGAVTGSGSRLHDRVAPVVDLHPSSRARPLKPST